MKDVYTENYKIFLKEIKEDINCKLNIVMMSILLKVIYRFNSITIKTQMILFQ